MHKIVVSPKIVDKGLYSYAETGNIINLTKRPLYQRVLRLPGLHHTHYKILHKHNGRLTSWLNAWRLAIVILR